MEAPENDERPGASTPGRFEPARANSLIIKLASSKGALVQSTVTAPLARRRITSDYLLDAPLPQLLAEFDVLLIDSRITDPTFTGGAVRREDGGLLFAMRPGQPAWERDAVARAMLGRELNVPMPPLPAPYQLAEV